MRKRQLRDGWRLYPHPDQYETILSLTSEVRTDQHLKQVEFALRLAGESGLRRAEIADTTRNDIVDAAGDVDAKFVEILGKDTTGETEEGKYRKAILTKATVNCLNELIEVVDPRPDEILIGAETGNTVNRWVKQIGEAAVERGYDSDFEHLTAHDLRARFATNCLVRHNMNMETVMTVGGWEDYGAMQAYLTITSDDQIVEDFEDAGLLDGVGWEAAGDSDDEIYSRLGCTTPAGAAAELSALGAEQMAARVESAADDLDDVEHGEETIGRFTASESKTAVKAGKYGAITGLVGASLAASVPSITTSAAFAASSIALLPPLARGWHRSD